MIAKLLHASLLGLAVLLVGGTASSPLPAIIINLDGQLVVDGERNWGSSKLIQLGYKIEKDLDVYVSEGVRATSDDAAVDYNIVRRGRIIFYVEVEKGSIARIVVLDDSIPIVVDVNKTISIGSSLTNTTDLLGPHDENFGEDPGMYLTFRKHKNFSLHTECSTNPLEQTDEEKRKTRMEFLRDCKIDRILALGDNGKEWK